MYSTGDFLPTTRYAQETITQWALELALKGLWTVMNKTVVPPSGDMHDYVVGAFSDLADAVLYNSVSHTFQDQPTSLYSQNVVNFLKVWFLNNTLG